MIITDFSTGGHQWIKTNLVTVGTAHPHDRYCCKVCGITGKSYNIGLLHVPEKFRSKLFNCPGVIATKKVRVTECRAVGRQFENLTPGSIHDVILPPPGENAKNGVWVQGVGEPVKLLSGEFIYLSNEQRTGKD